jgi:2-polyprenyl-3-methyl-5-hydroxy-6-metoxy-1,4-benzoquinol methylase
MNAPTIPRMPELPSDEFDAEYRRAEVEHPTELEKMIPEFENAVEMAPLIDFDFFEGGRRTVLDIGCGIGTLPFLLAKRNLNATVIGVDISEESISHARAHYEPKAANLSYHVGSVENLSQMFQGVDMITCVGALHHFPRLDCAVDQIMQTLNEDGAFLLSDLNRENVRSYFSDKELRYLDSVRKLPEKVRNNKLHRQGYTKGEKMRRFLTLMSFQAAYTPAEISQALGSRYGFKGRIAGVNYLLVAYKLNSDHSE